MDLEDNSGVKKENGVYVLTEDIELDLEFNTEFTETLDGNGYTITTDFNRPYIFSEFSGEIKNLKITDECSIVEENRGIIKNCEISYLDDSRDFTMRKGGICAENHGVIKNCKVETELVTDAYSGLITGVNYGRIEDSTTKGYIFSRKASGGICGRQEDGIIKDCSSSAEVESVKVCGGICGEQGDTGDSISFKRCSFTGEIHTSSFTGVIVGDMSEDSSTDITFKDCSSDCFVELNKFTLFSADIVDCNFTVEIHSSSINQAIFSQDIEVMDSKFDFSLLNTHISFCDSRSDSPTVTNVDFHFKLLTESNTDVNILEEIPIKESLSGETVNLTTSTEEIINEGIQSVTTEKELFNCNKYDTIELQDDIFITKDRVAIHFLLGDFNGNGYSIKNLTNPLIKKICNSSNVFDLTIINSFVNNHVKRDNTGCLAGINVGLLSNISVKNSTVRGFDPKKVGGIVGSSKEGPIYGEIKNCSVENITVRGNSTVGGIAGSIFIYNNIKVKNCTIIGNDEVGGIYGSGERKNDNLPADVSRENGCVIDSRIAGDKKIGGIFGKNGSFNNKNCCVKNTVIHGEEDVGGFGGEFKGGSIKMGTVDQCSIRGDTNVGGFLGEAREFGSLAEIHNCKSNSEVTGNEVSGFIGAGESVELLNCVSLGSVKGTKVAGFVYKCADVVIKKSYCKNSLTGDKQNGLFAITIRNSNISRCFTLSETTNNDLDLTSVVYNSGQVNFDLYWSSMLNPIGEDSVGEAINSDTLDDFKTMLI